jgi:flagellar M-ring protein FliF
MAEATLSSPSSALTASLKPILLLVGIAAAVAAGVTVVLWTRGPSYSLLYANIAAEDQSAIAQALDAAQIPYRIQPGSNNIEVASERVSEARMKLAGQGLPESSGGFALMDKDPGFGVSQFVENARYQHALETELARTIANLRPVEGARVHLAIPHQTAFVRDHHPGSASVFVQVKPGRRLEEGQVQAIVNLVASSVPEMEASQVTVVDQAGRLLSSPESHDEFALREQQFDMVHRVEDDYAQRIEALLTPMIGEGRVRAQVVAQMDMSVSEEAREQYRPDSQIVRSEQIQEQSSRDGSASGGVPGALTNQPPPSGVAQPPPNNTAPAAQNATGANATAGTNAANAANKGTPALTEPVGATGAGGNDASSSKSTTRNYEIDRTLAYTHQPAGKLKRLTVAVLVDNLRTTDKDGKVKETALTQAQLDHVTQLVKDAVGFDEARGDNVNVVNASFTSDAQPTDGDLESPPFWENPLFLNMAKLLGGVTVLLVLVLSVLRPMVRTLIGPVRPAVQLMPRTATAGGEAAAAPQVANGNSQAALPGAQSKEIALTHEQQVAQARTLVTQDAKRVAQVVRGWVAQDE